MDSLFILAGLLGAGDLLLTWYLWQERERRKKAESAAGRVLRDNYRLIDALERKAGIRPPEKPVVVPIGSRRRQAAETGGIA
jgi:hypothetical protein